MADTWITDMRHFLDEDGNIAELPPPAENLVYFLGSIVAWMTSHRRPPPWTNVRCRRSPGRRRCIGDIHAVFEDESGGIVWECPLCGDNGHISGWEDSPWDRRPNLVAAPQPDSPSLN